MFSMRELTEKQRQVFEYLERYISEQGYPPTIRELGETFDISSKAASDHLKAIEKKGYIRCGQNRSRAIELLKFSQNGPRSALEGVVSIPLVGQVAAGLPLVAEENIEEHLSFPKSMFKGDNLFALRVTGDSMKDAGILDKDIAILQKQSTAKNGDIVVALVEDEATLKYFYKNEKRICLQPANPSYKPIYVRNTILLGKLVGLYRFVS